MRKLFAWAVALLACASTLSAQDKNWKKTLEQQLKETYTITKQDTSLLAGNSTIKTPGVVLVVKQAGMMGNLPDVLPLLVRTSRVRNGQLQRGEGSSGPNSYLYKVGDKVYVANIDVNDDNIVFRVFTVEAMERTVKGSTKATRFFSMVRFDFEKAFLPVAALADVKKEISSVLATEEQLAAADTKTIELGQTIEQVEATFGKPAAVIKLGEKTIYTYKDIKVTFTNGKVTDVQ
jgi:hypothetical protein